MDKSMVLLESYSVHTDRTSFLFSGLEGEVEAYTPEEVKDALTEVDRAVAKGRHAAGFLCYEAASGLDPVLKTRSAGCLPPIWFGLFSERVEVAPGGLQPCGGYALSAWNQSISQSCYETAVRRIRTYIKMGDTYQVNFSFRMRAAFKGDDRAFYQDLCRSQRTAFSAYVDTGRFRILSASPELFFSFREGKLVVRPMKGTERRGRWLEEDDTAARALQQSDKDRAENVMVVDLLRNDLGKVSEFGSVEVSSLCEIERYETVLQMTSSIQSIARPDTGLVDLMAALFPCGSVTGAPKARTMEIISELENTPREVYTGSIGFVSPGLEARFNVAIRTAWIDRETGMAEFGVGSGVTYESSPQKEFEECLVKSQILTVKFPVFDLLETLRFSTLSGFFLFDQHLNRLQNSASYFGFRFDLGGIKLKLRKATSGLKVGSYRVRLKLSREGKVEIDHFPLSSDRDESISRVCISDIPVESGNSMLFHKTTCRQIYEDRLSRRPDCDEVILLNQRGEVTEFGIGNLVAILQGEKVTPPVNCGLLPGVFRENLLAAGEIREALLKVDDLRRAEGIYLINSVRGWVRVSLVD